MARKIHKGNTVVVISGDSRHLPIEKRVGKVKYVDKTKNRVVIEGINVRKVTLKKTSQNPQGGYVDKECPVHISNIMLKDVYDKRIKAKSSS